MTLPESWTEVPVTGTFTYYPSGDPVAGGRIEVRPLLRVLGDNAGVIPALTVIELDADGAVPAGTVLPSYDDTARGLAGVYYKISERFQGGREPFYILVRHDDASVNLATEPAVVPGPDLVSVLGIPAVQQAQAALTALERLMNAVTLYGADKTGVTDSTAAFAEAFAATNRVYAPAGTYLTTGLTVPSGCALIGDGGYSGATVIRLADGADAHVITNDDHALGNSDISIVGVKVEGNQANQTDGANVRGIHLQNVSGYYLRDVWCDDAKDHGIYTPQSTGGTVDSIKSTNSGSAAHLAAGGLGGTGILLGSGTTALHAYASGNHLNGFKSSGTDLTYIGCVSELNGGGFDTGTTAANDGEKFQKFISCAARDNDGYGWVLGAQTHQIELYGCSGHENGQSGVYILQNARHIRIFGGSYMNNGQSGVRGTYPASQTGIDGITITDSGGANFGRDILIQDAFIDDDQDVATQDCGIYIIGNPTGVRIKNVDYGDSGHVDQNFRNRSDADMEVTGCRGLSCEAHSITDSAVTGTTTETNLFTSNMIVGECHVGQVLRLVVQGTITGAAGTKTIRFGYGGTPVVLHSYLAADTGNWSADIEVTFLTKTTQMLRIILTKAGVVTSHHSTQAVSFTGVDRLFYISGQLGNAADSITVKAADIRSIR